MSSVPIARPPARNVRPCGPNDELLYTITDARGEPRLGAILWGRGVEYCKLAMDKLAAERGVTSFILMGTCACANLGFHAAIADSRVVGLILANPYVSTAQRVRALGWDKFSKPGAWKRCWTF